MSLNRPQTLWFFPHVCLSLDISRPPVVKVKPRTLTCIDLDSVCPMLINFCLLFSKETVVFTFYMNVLGRPNVQQFRVTAQGQV